MDNEASFGYWVRRRRKALDMTQQELAERVGCALDTIRKVESGARRPSRQVAERLADQLELPAEMRAAFLQAARAELAADRLALPSAPATTPLPATPPRPDQEVHAAGLPSGTITFLCTDIAGSTQLWERYPGAMRHSLARHDSILRQTIAAHSGVVFKSGGDGVFAAFTRAPDALAASVAIQHALQTETWDVIGPLRVRIVLHTGVAEERDGDYFGPPLNRAARLLAVGHGGQILISRATQELVCDTLPPEVVLRDLGTHGLKDLTRPEHLFQVVAPNLPADFPPLRTLDTRPHNLPAQLTPLIDRTNDVTAICDLLCRPDVRLLTLTGAPGIGKTRVGLKATLGVLEQFTDGVFLITLSAVSDPALVPMAIASALGVRDLDQRPMLERLTDALSSKQMLLVLDNFEHLLDATPMIVALVTASPDLKVLITSRAALRVSGEHEYAVPPLALPDPDHLPPLELVAQTPAVALFTTRARAVRPDFTLTAENVTSVAAICARLDGLPLAIELAAARSQLFTPQTMLKRLERRFAVLTSGPRDLPTRQQTLHRAITWSYDLLAPAQQLLFARLAVFVDGCTLQAAEAVCSSPAEHDLPVLEGLAALLGQSLLRREDGSSGEPRFRMLETVREYALDWLAARPDAELTYRQHATFYLGIAEAAEQQLRGAEQTSGIKWLRQEHANLLAAIGWAIARGEAEVALRLTGALGWFWDIHGQLSEGRDWLARALGLDGAVPLAIRARALFSAGLLAADHNDPTAAQALFTEALALYRQVEDIAEAAYTLCGLGRVKRLLGDYTAAQAYLTEGLALAQQAGDVRTIAYARYNLGRVTYQLGDYAAARALFTDGLAGFQECHDTWGIALSRCNLGRVAYRQGDYIAAEAQFTESLARFIAINDVWGIGLAHCKLGWIALCRGDQEAARARFAESLPHVQKVGYREGIADVLTGLATVAGAQGAWAQMARLLGAAGVILEAIGETLNTLDRDDYERAIANARTQLSAAAFMTAWEQGRNLPLDQTIAEALELLRESGLERSVAQPAVSPTAPATYPAGLTEREIEILRLVAQGLTDALVAERLVISPRTVQGHLRSIYGKLDVTSRTAATRFAIEHHIV
jgi:predicted ATPase/class 3 adenylate cyclase/DNA-binding CsgD family transcriptional regulator